MIDALFCGIALRVDGVVANDGEVSADEDLVVLRAEAIVGM